MSKPIVELLIPKTPRICMSGNVILLDIEDVVPGWETYTFSLNTIQPGEKQIVLRIKHCAVETNSVEIQTENAITSDKKMIVCEDIQSDNHAEITIPIEDDPGLPDPVKLEDKEVPLNVTGDYIRCPIIPCHLLIRHDIPNYVSYYHSKYLIRAFDTSFLPLKTAGKRLSLEEYQKRLHKRLWLV